MNNPIASLPQTVDTQLPDGSRAKIALENVLSSQAFSDMSRLKRFLEYVVTETIEGRAHRLKGVVIACEVFDKTDPDEAQSTTIVRVEAGRLRRRLDDYYRREGKNETLRIRMPKGGYVVEFEDVAKERSSPDTPSNNTETRQNWVRRSWKNPEDSARILELIEQIRKQGV